MASNILRFRFVLYRIIPYLDVWVVLKVNNEWGDTTAFCPNTLPPAGKTPIFTAILWLVLIIRPTQTE